MADEEVDSVEINEDSMYVEHLSGEEVDMEMSETAPVFDEKGEKEGKKRKRRLTSKVRRSFDPEKFRELVTAAAIMHDLPFQFTEWAGIRAIFHHLHGDLHLVNRNTCEADCLKMFKRERGKIHAMLQATLGRINLTLDCWSSLTTDGYICLTAHFIDKDWHLQKRILNFCFMPSPNSGTTSAQKLLTSLTDWGIAKKIFSITLDNVSCNDVSIDKLDKILTLTGGLLCNGEHLRIRCCSHIVNLVVQDGLEAIDDSLQKIRESIKYIKETQARKQKFLECVAYSSLDAERGLRQDVPTRWDSTFIMLDTALYYKHAFLHLELSDSNYKYCPSRSEWAKVEKIWNFLGPFYEITCIFRDTNYRTANLYFPAVFSAYLTLKEQMKSSDEYMRIMATKMHEKFDKYWADFSTILAIAVSLDPRFKFVFVEWCYKKLYGDDGISKAMLVKNKLLSLFYEYSNGNTFSSSSPSSSNIVNKNAAPSSNESPFSRGKRNLLMILLLWEFDSFRRQKDGPQKSQLEYYLEEPQLNPEMELDVLDYWKVIQCIYPKVAAMARDILSIPISAVASQSAFSVGGRVLDQYQSALEPDIVEALACTRDWLYGEQEVRKLTFEKLTKDVIEMGLHDKETSPF